MDFEYLPGVTDEEPYDVILCHSVSWRSLRNMRVGSTVAAEIHAE